MEGQLVIFKLISRLFMTWKRVILFNKSWPGLLHSWLSSNNSSFFSFRSARRPCILLIYRFKQSPLVNIWLIRSVFLILKHLWSHILSNRPCFSLLHKRKIKPRHVFLLLFLGQYFACRALLMVIKCKKPHCSIDRRLDLCRMWSEQKRVAFSGRPARGLDRGNSRRNVVWVWLELSVLVEGSLHSFEGAAFVFEEGVEVGLAGVNVLDLGQTDGQGGVLVELLTAFENHN